MGRSRWLVLGVAALVATGCWNQYRSDAGHSGNQPFEFVVGVGNVSTLGTAFTAPVAAGVTTAPTLGEGFAFVTSDDGRLRAFDAAGVDGCTGAPATCAPLWSAMVGPDALRTSPAVSGGVVYVQGRERLYAYDAHGVDGCSGSPVVCTPLWSSTVIGDVLASPTIADGRVYTAGASGLVVFDAAGAQGCSNQVCGPLWTSQAVSPTRDASPAVVDGRVYLTGDGTLYVYDAAGVQGCQGQVCIPLWRASNADSAPAVVAGRVYVASRAGTLRAFDVAGPTGCAGTPVVCAPLWTTSVAPAAGTAMEPPAVAKGRVFVQSDGAVLAFDAHGVDGCLGAVCSPIWRSAGDGAIGAPAAANGIVYVGGAHLRAFDTQGFVDCAGAPATCDPLWTSSNGDGFSAPVVLSGTVYVGTPSGLSAYRTSVNAPAPTIDAVVPFVPAGVTTNVSVFGSGFGTDATVTTALPGATVGPPSPGPGGSVAVSVTVPPGTPAGGYLLRVVTPDGRRASAPLTVQSDAGAAVAARSGISAFPGIMWQPAADRDRSISEIAASGAEWILFDLDWRALQQSATDWNGWSRGANGNGGFDAAVTAAHARGLQVLGTITYSPPWARDLSVCPYLGDGDVGHCFPTADHVADYAAFAGAAAARYGSQSTDPALRDTVTAWQLWNEPNHQEFSQPFPDPARYADMEKQAYAAIKGADPDATVITGGTAPASDQSTGGHQVEYSPTSWLDALYANGAQGSFDGVGHHPYSFPWNPLDYNASWNAYSITESLHEIMTENGDGTKRVWGTEMGVATGSVACGADATSPCSMSDAGQADWVRHYYTGWNSPDYHGFPSFTGPLIIKAIRDNSANPMNLWDNLGLIRVDGTPKPSYGAYRDLMTYGLG
jgi:hypothetical protein